LATRPKSIDPSTFVGPGIARRPIVRGRPVANPVRMLTRLAHLTFRHRWAVIGAWLVLTLFGAFAAGRVSNRWLQSFSIPGYSAYAASERTLERFGTGMRTPNVVVFHTSGDATKSTAIRAAMERAAQASPHARTSSFFSTGSLAYVTRDRHTTFMEIYPPGTASFDKQSGAEATRRAAADGLPAGISVHVTGHDPLEEASSAGDSGGASVLLEVVIGGLGALVILLFVFGTLPAVLMPLVVAAAAILNTFTLVWALTYVTDVSIVVQFLIALVGLGVAIDYALLVIFRFRDELRGGSVESALAETMRRAGRAVIVSGSTVAVGLLSLIVLPVPFIRSIGIGGMLIPAVSVIAAITLLPAMLAVLGERINSVRVFPRRLVGVGRPEDGAWGRLGTLRESPPATGRARRHCDRRRAGGGRHAAQRERGAAEVVPRPRRRRRRPRPAARCRHQPRGDEAVRRARRGGRRPHGGRRKATRRAGNCRRGRSARLAAR
jgi:RND superfamily putative drug exporter